MISNIFLSRKTPSSPQISEMIHLFLEKSNKVLKGWVYIIKSFADLKKLLFYIECNQSNSK